MRKSYIEELDFQFLLNSKGLHGMTWARSPGPHLPCFTQFIYLPGSCKHFNLQPMKAL